MRLVLALVRLAISASILVAVTATFAATAARATIVPANFFGYFTVQSNLLAVPVLIAAAGLLLAGQAAPRWFEVVRACSATYLVVVGVVYAVLLAPLGAAGGVPLPWANIVLHVVSCVLVPLDWVLVADRGRLPWRALPWVLLYPLVWCAVALVRGATDGWVPYPFLSPSRGYPAIALAVVGIGAATLAAGALILGASRLRVLRPVSGASPSAPGSRRLR